MTPEELKSLLAEAGLSQAALAEELEVDVGTVSRWCRGVIPISKLVSVALYATLGEYLVE